MATFEAANDFPEPEDLVEKEPEDSLEIEIEDDTCLLYTSPSPRD